ncbi:MAG: hypothetical protein HY323_04260 [Betaproteobacteria bacterium]|nr:hypothetical protein [Betaproteobacteria bacterium]
MTSAISSVRTHPDDAAARVEQRQLVLLERVRLAYGHLPSSQLVALAGAIVLAAVQWSVAEPVAVIVWLACFCAVTAARVGDGVAFRRARPPAGGVSRWRNHFLAGAVASGAVWGAAAAVLFPVQSLEHQVFLAFVLGGMVAGAVTTLTPVFPAFALFALAVLLPVITRFLLGGGLIHSAMGWMLALYLAAMIVIGRRIHRAITDALNLRYENSALIAYLTSARDHAEALNQELRSTQAALQKSNEELERRVEERTAELSRINAELEKFAFVASHDLQEPLRTVANFAGLLEARYRDRLDEDANDYIAFIVEGTAHMRAMIDGLLAFSRAGAQYRAFAETDCEAVFGRAVEGLSAAIHESGATIVHDRLPRIFADGRLVEQVFRNLVGNAIKFRGREPPRVEVNVSSDDTHWIFSVRDNGIGISPRHHRRIFEIFERLHGADKYPGTGIGLAVCNKIVDSHGGKIWVESQEGQGATFRFTIPRLPGRGA